MESLELDAGRLVSQQQHDLLQVVSAADVARHHREVVSVQQQLTQQLQQHQTPHTNMIEKMYKNQPLYSACKIFPAS